MPTTVSQSKSIGRILMSQKESFRVIAKKLVNLELAGTKIRNSWRKK